MALSRIRPSCEWGRFVGVGGGMGRGSCGEWEVSLSLGSVQMGGKGYQGGGEVALDELDNG